MIKKSILGVLTTCLLFILIACTVTEHKEVGNNPDYRPMVFVNNQLFGDTGETVSSLPEGWKLLGAIKKVIKQNEPMEHEEFTSNSLTIGDEIYINEQENNRIYVKIDDGKYLLYEIIND